MNYGSSSEALADSLMSEIAHLAPGDRLPSNRELIARHAVSASTVSAALGLLTQRGAIETRPGIGAFVPRRSAIPPRRDTAWQSSALDLGAGIDDSASGTRTFDATHLRGTLTSQPADVIDLNSGYLHPDLQPLNLLQRAFARAAKRPSTWHRPPLAGIPELRTWFAREIGGDLGSDDVVISPGGQAALATVLRALTQPGDPVIVESPTYPGTIAAARASGVRPVPVAVTPDGMDSASLDDALARTRARLVVVQPLFQNPTGVSMTSSRRAEILSVARAHRAFVLEDDFARYLGHSDGPRLPAPLVVDDPDGTVIHIRSFTKVASPNIRVAAVVSRGTVSARLRDAFTIENMLVPAPLQFVTLEAVSQAGWRSHQRALAEELASRRQQAAQTVCDALGPGALPLEPHGGYHLWVRLPDAADPRELASHALRAGVAVTPGPNYEPGSAAAPHLRLSYVAAPTAADVVEGVRRLGSALNDASLTREH